MPIEAGKLLDVNGLDYSILFIYFTIVLAIGFLAKRAIAMYCAPFARCRPG